MVLDRLGMGKYCCGCSGRYGKCVACTCVKANKLCVDCRPGEIFRCVNKALASSQPCRSVSPVPMASHAASQPTESMRDSPSLPLTALAPASSRPYLENSAIDDLLMSCRNPDRTQRHPDRTQRHSRTHRHDPPPAPTRPQSEDAHLAGGTVAAESQSEDAHIAGGTVAAESQDPSSETEDVETGVEVSPTDAELLASLADSPSMAHPAVSDQDEGIPPTDAELLASLADSQSMAQPVVNVNADQGSTPPTATAEETQCPMPNNACLKEVYNEIITWRRNLFMIPLDRSGKELVPEFAEMIGQFANGAPNGVSTWAAITVASHLLLQKPSPQSKAKDHVEHLTRRLGLWRENRLSELLDEGRCVQAHLVSRPHRNDSGDKDDIIFANLAYSGKVKSAARYLSSEPGQGVLRLDDTISAGRTVRDVLHDKHSPSTEPPDYALLDGDPPPVNPILFDRLTPPLIRATATTISGSAGPSGLDADAWQRLLTCFKAASDKLCAAMALAARRICTASVPPESMEAFTAARLIPLAKTSGVRPIAVGEVFRRVIGKAIIQVINRDVRDVIFPYQLCVGIPSGCEVALHAMDQTFHQTNTEGVLCVDAENAFNSLNRQAALHNVPRLCPALGQVFCNTYQAPIRLFAAGGGEIASKEGTSQGDPLAMAIYAVATIPMIKAIAEECPSTSTLWYADDDAAAGTIAELKRYWESLLDLGPGFGYHPNSSKTVLLTKPDHLQAAQRAFAGTGIEIVDSGVKYLGGTIGSNTFAERQLVAHTEKWKGDIIKCAEFAKTQPHAAYAITVRSLTSQWLYAMRVIKCENKAGLLRELDRVVCSNLLPELCGLRLGPESPLRKLLSVPARHGGIAIPIGEAMAEAEEDWSRRITAPLAHLVTGVSSSPPRDTQPDLLDTNTQSSAEPTPIEQLQIALSDSRAAASQVRKEKGDLYSTTTADIADQLSPPQQLLTDIAGEKSVSSWLTTAPRTSLGTVLRKTDFKDAVCVRYDLPLPGLPPTCVCSAPMSATHAMTCPAGGYPTARHNEVRDVICGIMKEVAADVQTEPTLSPYEGESLHGRTANRAGEARLDIRARSFWTRQQDAYFDVRVTHPKASLLSCQELRRQLEQNEQEKKRQYGQRVTEIERGSFTPLVFATNGMCARGCNHFLKALALRVVEKNTGLHYSVVVNHLRSKLSFCLLRWCITCLRGCRASYTRTSSFVAECALLQG